LNSIEGIKRAAYECLNIYPFSAADLKKPDRVSLRKCEEDWNRYQKLKCTVTRLQTKLIIILGDDEVDAKENQFPNLTKYRQGIHYVLCRMRCHLYSLAYNSIKDAIEDKNCREDAIEKKSEIALEFLRIGGAHEDLHFAMMKSVAMELAKTLFPGPGPQKILNAGIISMKQSHRISRLAF